MKTTKVNLEYLKWVGFIFVILFIITAVASARIPSDWGWKYWLFAGLADIAISFIAGWLAYKYPSSKKET